MSYLVLCGPGQRLFAGSLLLAGLLLGSAFTGPQLSLGLNAAYAQGQKNQPFYTLRAVNLARMRAESLNGGLSVYRPQTCIYEDNGGPYLRSRTAKGLLFRFLGGAPGWQEQNQPATLETEILISADGRQVLDVPYNGQPRPMN